MKNNMNLKTVAIYSVGIAFSLSILACTSDQGKGKDSAAVKEVASETTAVPVAEEAVTNSGVSFLDENKKVIALNDLKGKVVFINFWATWCPPCVEEMPSINALKKRYKNDPNVVFLMVDVDNNYEKSKKFMEKGGFDLPVHLPNGEIPSNFLGNAIPTTVILDKSGEMVGRMEGGRDYASPEMIKAMDDLVAKK